MSKCKDCLHHQDNQCLLNNPLEDCPKFASLRMELTKLRAKISDEWTKDEVIDHLGESFHTAFRKASDSKEASQIHVLIRKMNKEDWKGILEFVYECIEPTPILVVSKMSEE